MAMRNSVKVSCCTKHHDGILFVFSGDVQIIYHVPVQIIFYEYGYMISVTAVLQ